MTRNELIGVALAIIFIAAAWVSIAIQYSDCESIDGEFVRSLFWFDCI